jgi:hypothetical protein
MTDAQKVNYWRNQSKTQQKLREQRERELEDERKKNKPGSGTVPDQQQGSGTAQVDEAAVRSEAAQDAALATIRSSLALRGKKSEDIDELVDLLSPAKFVTADHKVDTAKVVAFIEKNAPVGTTSGGGGGGGTPGQGHYGQQPSSKKALGEAEAARRGYGGLKKQPQTTSTATTTTSV